MKIRGGGRNFDIYGLIYNEKNKKLKLDMTTEKQQFYSDALLCNQLQNILRFCQKNAQIWRATIRFFRTSS